MLFINHASDDTWLRLTMTLDKGRQRDIQEYKEPIWFNQHSHTLADGAIGIRHVWTWSIYGRADIC